MHHISRSMTLMLICFLLLFPLINQENVNADDFEEPDPGVVGEPSQGGPYNPDMPKWVNNIMSFIFTLTGNYNLASGYAPKIFTAEPYIIEIDYLGNATTDIIFGHYRRNASGYQPAIYDDITLYFDAIFPDDVQTDSFRVYFDPPVLDLRSYHNQFDDPKQIPNPRTTMHISLEIPATPDNPIQDFNLTVEVSIERKYTNFLGKFFGAIKFFNVFNSVSVGKKSCDVFVRVKPFRYAEMSEPPTVSLRPNDMKTVQFRVQNRGSDIESFGFSIKNNTNNIYITPPPPVTLSPGESMVVNLGVMAGIFPYDKGTLHRIQLELYAMDNPNQIIAVNEFAVLTQGFAIQAIFSFKYSWHLFFASIFIIFILIIYFIIKRIKLTSHCKKPKKPWTRPKEKQHLEKLLQENKNDEYKSTMEMMKQEYASSLLWYKYYRKSLIKEERKKGKLVIFLINLKNSILKFFKNLVNKLKILLQERKEKKLELEEQKVAEEEIKEEKPEEMPEFKEAEIVEEEDIETKIKDKTLSKIRKQQEKQKRKLGRKPIGDVTKLY